MKLKGNQNKIAAGAIKTGETILCPYIKGAWGCTLPYGHTGQHVNKIMGRETSCTSQPGPSS